ncbi:hypothetical protein OFN50_41515, partial [Escherichia coli]|nr:hypothetical protein [Escherichia coli]
PEHPATSQTPVQFVDRQSAGPDRFLPGHTDRTLRLPVGHEALQARFMLVQHMAAAAQHPAGFGQWCEQIYPYITD